MKKSKLLLILCMVVVLALGVLVSCDKNKGETCAHESYGAWQITKAPTTTETGTAIRVCANGDNVETVTLAKLSDTSVWTPSASTATHEAAGEITYTSTYGSVKVAVDRLSDHVYDREVAQPQFLVSAADCTNAAVYRKSCVCGAVGTATFTSGNPAGHQTHPVQAVAAVHTADSLVNAVAAHHKCDACGKLFTDAAGEHETTLAALTTVTAHTYGGWTLVADATCTVDGSITRTCTASGCGHVDTQVIPAHDHDYSSGLIVLVTNKDIWQEDDGSVTEGDEYATEFHAPVCDICHTINKDAKVAHEYGEWEFVVVKDHIGHDVHKQHVCEVCNYKAYEMQGENVKTYGYLEYSWTAGETVAPTYTTDGSTVYTKGGTDTVTLVLPKLVAPYDNKSYIGAIEISPKEEQLSGMSSSYHRNLDLKLNNVGKGTGTSSPFMGDVTVTMINGATGELTLVVGNSTYVGYVEPSTGIMVISDDNFTTVHLVTPYEATANSVTASYWNNAIAIDYHIDCGTYLGHDISILVHNGVVTFGVTFMVGEGDIIGAEECYKQDMFGAMLEADEPLVIFVRNGSGVLQAADEYIGEYQAAEDSLNVGSLTVNGVGEWTCEGNGTISACGGTYAKHSDGKFDVYVVADGKKVQYYIAEIDVENGTYNLLAQTVTITLDAGSHGTVKEPTLTAFVGCVIPALPTPTANTGSDYVFLRWLNGGVDVTADTTFTADVTLTAKWAPPATINVVVEKDNVITKTISVETPILSVLTEYKEGETLNSVGKVFAGWYLTEDCSGDPIEEDMAPGESEDAINVYAKWVNVTWTIKESSASHYSFEYNAEKKLWQSTNKNSNGSNAILQIVANGPITVSFKYAASSEGGNYDYIVVEFLENASASAVEKGKDGNNVTFDQLVWKEYSQELTKGQILQLRYRKDSSGHKGEDRGYVKDLVINGAAVTIMGTMPDDYKGEYTCEGSDNLIIDGCGSFTWGTKIGTYAKAVDNDTIDMYVVDNDGANTEYYVLTLEGTTYSVTKPMANITFVVPDYCDEVTSINVNKNIPVASLPDSTATNAEGRVFIGWYSNNGNDGEWGELVTAPITLTEDITLYARWVTPNALLGTYNGYAFGSSATSTVTTVTIDELGVVTSDTMKGAVVESYDAETGAVWFVKGSDKYYGVFDASNGSFVINASATKEATIGSAPYLLFSNAEVANQKYLVTAAGTAYKAVAMEVNGTDRLFLLDENALHLDVNVVVNKADGTSVSDIATLRTLTTTTNGFIYVVTKDNDHLVSIAYMSGLALTVCDGTEGMYTNDGNSVWVLGIGGIMMDGKLGKLVAVEGQESTYIANIGTTSNATPVKESYVITLDVTNKTYTIADNKVEVSFNFGGLSGSLESLRSFAGVETTLPATGPEITGYIFRGWYSNEGLTTKVTKVTPTEDTVIYAKYDKAITVTVIYGNGIAEGSVTDKFANDKVTVALPEPANDLYPVGWFTTSTFDEGTEWNSGSAVIDDLTIYCKWTEPNALMGTYKGYNIYSTSNANPNKNITIDALGNITGSQSGSAASYDGTSNYWAWNGTIYAYYDPDTTLLVRPNGSSSTEFGTDVWYYFRADSVTTSSSEFISWNSNKNRIIKFTVDGTTVWVILNNNKIYVGDTLSVVTSSGTTVDQMSSFAQNGNVLTLTKQSNSVLTLGYVGNTWLESDGKQGTYTGTIGTVASITVDGYGMVTVGDDTVAYILDGSKITFALNNRTMVVELGDGTCAQVQDGIAGTYTLPDDAGTIVLDGLGGAGDNATYVVNGAQITIYTADGSTIYGLDVENKILLGKSIFAGLTFTGSTPETNISYGTSLKLIFNEVGPIAGSFVAGSTYSFTGTYDESTKVLTIVLDDASHTTITANVASKKITFTSDFVVSNVDHIKDVVMTCNSFILN